MSANVAITSGGFYEKVHLDVDVLLLVRLVGPRVGDSTPSGLLFLLVSPNLSSGMKKYY